MKKGYDAVFMWAQDRNLPVPYGSAVQVICLGDFYSVSRSHKNTVCITVKIKKDNVTSGTLRLLNTAMKPLHAKVKAKAGVLLCCEFSVKNDIDSTDTINKALDAFATQLQLYDITVDNTCVACGDDLADGGIDNGHGLILPIHDFCNRSNVGQELSKIHNSDFTNNHHVLGVLGALLGGFVGALPALVLAICFQELLTILFFLVPVGATMGYQLFKGKRTEFMAVTVLLVSLVVVLASYGSYRYTEPFCYFYRGLRAIEQVEQGTLTKEQFEQQFTGVSLEEFEGYHDEVVKLIKKQQDTDGVFTLRNFYKVYPVKNYHKEKNFLTFLISTDEFGLFGEEFWWETIQSLVITVGGSIVAILLLGDSKRRRIKLQDTLKFEQAFFNPLDSQGIVVKELLPLSQKNHQFGNTTSTPWTFAEPTVEHKKKPRENTPIHDELFADVLEDSPTET